MQKNSSNRQQIQQEVSQSSGLGINKKYKNQIIAGVRNNYQFLISPIKNENGSSETHFWLVLFETNSHLILQVEQNQCFPQCHRFDFRRNLKISLPIDQIQYVRDDPLSREILLLSFYKQGPSQQFKLDFHAQEIKSKWMNILLQLKDPLKKQSFKRIAQSFPQHKDRLNDELANKKGQSRNEQLRQRLPKNGPSNQNKEGQIQKERNRQFIKNQNRCYEQQQNDSLTNENKIIQELINKHETEISKIRQINKNYSLISQASDLNSLSQAKKNRKLKVELKKKLAQIAQLFQSMDDFKELQQVMEKIDRGLWKKTPKQHKKGLQTGISEMSDSRRQLNKPIQIQIRQGQNKRKEESEPQVQHNFGNQTQNLSHSSMQRNNISKSKEQVDEGGPRTTGDEGGPRTTDNSFDFILSQIRVDYPEQQQLGQAVGQPQRLIDEHRKLNCNNHNSILNQIQLSQQQTIKLRNENEANSQIKARLGKKKKEDPMSNNNNVEQRIQQISKLIEQKMNNAQQRLQERFKLIEKKMNNLQSRIEWRCYQIFKLMEKKKDNNVNLTDQKYRQLNQQLNKEIQCKIQCLKEEFKKYYCENKSYVHDLFEHLKKKLFQKQKGIKKLQEAFESNLNLQNISTPLGIKPYNSIFQGEILRQLPELKQYLKQEIEKYTKKAILTTTHLYTLGTNSLKNSFHNNVDGKANIILLAQTKNRALIAGYSQSAYYNLCQNQPNQRGIIFSLSNRKAYPLIEGKNSLKYTQNYLIFGKSEIRIDPNNKKLLSNFGIQHSNFKTQGSNVHEFLGEGSANEVDLMTFEVHQIVYQLNDSSISV